MVGIVLVSHSQALAESVAELARAMGETTGPVEVAGGIDEPGALGTDAVRVASAIERADQGEGVLVLVDLGSAVLSAELALDLIAPELRERVRVSEAPLVEGAVAAAVTAGLGSPLDAVAAEARGGLRPKQEQLGAPAEDAPAALPEASGGAIVEARLQVTNAHGLHARPAARFVQTAARFDAETTVRNLRSGAAADARSLNSLATLGVREGDEIVVSARGAEAAEAIEALEELVAHLAGNGRDGAQPATRPAVAVPEAEGTLRGLPAAPGTAVGPARHVQREPAELPDAPAASPDEELAALERALAAAGADVEAARDATRRRAGEPEAAIFDAHLLLLGDEALVEPARRAVELGQAAAGAWRDAVADLAARYDALEDEYQRARAADLRALGDSVLAHLVGARATSGIGGPGIVVAPELSPAETAALDASGAAGIATAFGGPTSHVAILARALGLPAVVGLGDHILAVAEGEPLALDGDAGTVLVAPTPELAAEYAARAEARAAQARESRARAAMPAVTRDGTTVEVAANVASPSDLPAVLEAGADGVGLLRTEFLFLERETAPSEQEQEAVYRQIAEALAPRPVVLRTLDAGADKPLPFLREPPEANPFLGVRGLRLSLARPELFRAQLRAAVRVARDLPLRVMFPMVTTLDELEQALALVDEPRPPLGIMVEVPAAALAARSLAPSVEFFSIGTNDLTQYTLAADRGNERVAALADALHPAVLQLVSAVTAAGRPVAVCGELAGDAAAVPLLVGLGVRELSVSPPLVPGIKDRVRALDLERAATVARRALELDSAAAVRELVSRELDGR